ncbi:MAG TPA: hypothetical protein PLD23_05480 [Armatimonadota bacterium]|nr:hypothetical protein [Armatimonadota bacterium]HQK92932.1 hypothetical protein [Armatimonadota bacterium]
MFRVVWLLLAVVPVPCAADLVISGNDGKLDLTTGGQLVLPNPQPDSISLLDFATFPPQVTHVPGVSNSVLGPPTNVAITPDETLALVASSARLVAGHPPRQVLDHTLRVVDLTVRPPKVVDCIRVGLQPSGLSVSRDGRTALVANRGDGTVSVLSIRGRLVRQRQVLRVCEPKQEPCHVAMADDGTRAVVSIRNRHALRVLRCRDGVWELEPGEVPVYLNPYRCAICPGGRTALVAGGTTGLNADAISVVDLAVTPPRTVDHVAVGSGIESFALSPDGSLVAAVAMNGSNLPDGAPGRTDNGLLVLLARQGDSLRRVQRMALGRVPEGVTFTPDGRYLLVQEYVDRRIVVLPVLGARVGEPVLHIEVPGMPASIRGACGID